MANRHKKRCSASPAIKEVQFKTTVRQHITHVRMTVIKKTKNKCWRGCGVKRTLCTVNGNVNWCSYYGKQYGGFSKIKKRTTIWSINTIFKHYTKKMKTLTQKDMCTSMFIAALFIIAKVCKQPKCPLMDKWIKKLYSMEYYSAIKRIKSYHLGWYLKDKSWEHYAKWNKSDKERQHSMI